MIRVLILCEGQTEETFIRQIIAPHLGGRNIFVTAPLATTSRVKKGPVFKGGIVSYPRFKNDIVRLLKSNPDANLITSMIDFYGLPNDFPGRVSLPSGSCYDRCRYLEGAISTDINDRRFMAHLSLHEFEAMLYVDPMQVSSAFPATRVESKITAIRASFANPEEINDHPETAPSRRLLNLIPEYRKPLHGVLITQRIGLERIRAECPHFNAWINTLESL